MNVYDFDNTLYDGESILQMFRFYLRKHPGIALHLPHMALTLLKYKQDKLTLDEMLAGCNRVVEPFLKNSKNFEKEAVRFWDRHENRLFPFYKHQQRPDDLIISASPEYSLREICKRMGVKRYIGTVINEKKQTIEFLCFGKNKVKIFRERYPDEQIENFYTDSMSDKPLMDIARHVFLLKKGWMQQIK